MISFKQFLLEAPTFTQIIQHLGKNNGLEHVFYRDRKTRMDSPILTGDKNSIDTRKLFGRSFRERPQTNAAFNKNPHFQVMHQPEHSLMHNHPRDTALSGSDTWQLLHNPKLKAIHAVTPSGSMYAAKLTDSGKKLMMHPHGPIADGLKSASYRLYSTYDEHSNESPGPLKGLDDEHSTHLEGHILNTALHNAGIIHYKHFMRGNDVNITSQHQELINSVVPGITQGFLNIRKHYGI